VARICGSLPNSVSIIHRNGAKNLKGAKPFLCIALIESSIQNGRVPNRFSDLMSPFKMFRARKIHKFFIHKIDLSKIDEKE